jgi:hypothetical protein|uniref:DIM protein n=1 Tax=Myoviridae sp. ctA4D8 TaxID=2823535 RepID=A0A8S5L6L4_9CAUD|nr:MAG TPA: DIM protein [Myoviridae sp. ctA4D8]
MKIISFLFLFFFIFGLTATIYGMIKSYNISWAKIRPGDIVILRDPFGKHISLIAIRESFFGTKFMTLYKDRNGNVDLSLLHPRDCTTTSLSLILRNYHITEIDRTYIELYKRAYAYKFK